MKYTLKNRFFNAFRHYLLTLSTNYNRQYPIEDITQMNNRFSLFHKRESNLSLQCLFYVKTHCFVFRTNMGQCKNRGLFFQAQTLDRF